MSSKTRSREVLQWSNMTREEIVATPVNAKYGVVSERMRSAVTEAQACAMFCGGLKCKYCNPSESAKWKPEQMEINGLYSNWVTENILATSRPSTHLMKAFNIIRQFQQHGISTIINLQVNGEHASCGWPLESDGFSYKPQDFMDHDIFFYNFGWHDYGVGSLTNILDMVKVMQFALSEGKVAIHCHAGLGRTGVLIACYLVYANRLKPLEAVQYVRHKRSGAIQTRGQLLCIEEFYDYLKPLRVIFPLHHDTAGDFTLTQFLNRQKRILHGEEGRMLKFVPKIVYECCKRLVQIAGRTFTFQPSFTTVSLRVRPSSSSNRTATPMMQSYLGTMRSNSVEPAGIVPTPLKTIRSESNLSLVGEHDGRLTRESFTGVAMTEAIMADFKKKLSQLDIEVDEGLAHRTESIESISTMRSGRSSRLSDDDFSVISTDTPVDERSEDVAIGMGVYAYSEKVLNEVKKLKSDCNQDCGEAYRYLQKCMSPETVSALMWDWLDALKQPILTSQDLPHVLELVHNPWEGLRVLDRGAQETTECIFSTIALLHPVTKNTFKDVMCRAISVLSHQNMVIEVECIGRRGVNKIKRTRNNHYGLMQPHVAARLYRFFKGYIYSHDMGRKLYESSSLASDTLSVQTPVSTPRPERSSRGSSTPAYEHERSARGASTPAYEHASTSRAPTPAIVTPDGKVEDKVKTEVKEPAQQAGSQVKKVVVRQRTFEIPKPPTIVEPTSAAPSPTPHVTSTRASTPTPSLSPDTRQRAMTPVKVDRKSTSRSPTPREGMRPSHIPDSRQVLDDPSLLGRRIYIPDSKPHVRPYIAEDKTCAIGKMEQGQPATSGKGQATTDRRRMEEQQKQLEKVKEEPVKESKKVDEKQTAKEKGIASASKDEPLKDNKKIDAKQAEKQDAKEKVVSSKEEPLKEKLKGDEKQAEKQTVKEEKTAERPSSSKQQPKAFEDKTVIANHVRAEKQQTTLTDTNIHQVNYEESIHSETSSSESKSTIDQSQGPESKHGKKTQKQDSAHPSKTTVTVEESKQSVIRTENEEQDLVHQGIVQNGSGASHSASERQVGNKTEEMQRTSSKYSTKESKANISTAKESRSIVQKSTTVVRNAADIAEYSPMDEPEEMPTKETLRQLSTTSRHSELQKTGSKISNGVNNKVGSANPSLTHYDLPSEKASLVSTVTEKTSIEKVSHKPSVESSTVTLKGKDTQSSIKELHKQRSAIDKAMAGGQTSQRQLELADARQEMTSGLSSDDGYKTQSPAPSPINTDALNSSHEKGPRTERVLKTTTYTVLKPLAEEEQSDAALESGTSKKKGKKDGVSGPSRVVGVRQKMSEPDLTKREAQVRNATHSASFPLDTEDSELSLDDDVPFNIRSTILDDIRGEVEFVEDAMSTPLIRTESKDQLAEQDSWQYLDAATRGDKSKYRVKSVPYAPTHVPKSMNNAQSTALLEDVQEAESVAGTPRGKKSRGGLVSRLKNKSAVAPQTKASKQVTNQSGSPTPEKLSLDEEAGKMKQSADV